MKIAITGSSGLIGTALRKSLATDGHDVVRLVRRSPTAPDEVQWDPAASSLDPTALEGVDGGVNLAGVGFGDRRWTESFKKKVRDSRVASTQLFSKALGDVGATVLISGSAIGYYGNRGDDVMTEESPPGDDFGASVCVEWESATEAARQAGVRVAHIRTGLVMSADASLVKRLVLPFKLGVGGRIGSGRQYWSWIDIHDEVAAIRFLLDGDGLAGPYNLTAPTPLRFDEVKKILGKILHRPTILPVPSFAMKLLFGAERAESIVLAGQRVIPQRLVDAGFEFAFTDLEASLRHHLGR